MKAAPLRIVVGDDDSDIREYLEEVLPRLGHEVVGSAADGMQLVERCLACKPDLLITDIKMPQLDGIEASRVVNAHGPVPVILLSAHHDGELVAQAAKENVLAYLVKPISEANLRAAIPVAMLRFRHMQTLTDEAATLRQSLEERKLIEKAKGIVVRRLRIEEEDAFRRLRQLATSHNRKIVDVSRQIITAEEVFHNLEAIVIRDRS